MVLVVGDKQERKWKGGREIKRKGRKEGRKKRNKEGRKERPREGGREVRRKRRMEERDTWLSHIQYWFTEHGSSQFTIVNNDKLLGSMHW